MTFAFQVSPGTVSPSSTQSSGTSHCTPAAPPSIPTPIPTTTERTPATSSANLAISASTLVAELLMNSSAVFLCGPFAASEISF
jgi:hypothetical protein